MKRKTVKWWVGLGFPAKKALEDHIRGIVNKYPDNTPISDSDRAFMETVLSHHYQWQNKIGAGIAFIEIRSNTNWSGTTRGFWIVRTDNTSIDISWVVALTPEGKPPQKSYVTSAARYEVYPQIHAHHNDGDCSFCPICDHALVRGFEVHVDHEYPFDNLFSDFMEMEGIGYDSIEIEDLGIDSRFADRALGRRWQMYHEGNAKLRLVHARCNLTRLK